MNILAGDSRARGLKNGIPRLSRSIVISGGTIDKVTEAVVESLKNRYFHTPPHVYVFAGINDLTRLVKDHRRHYTECIFDTDTQTAIHTVTQKFNTCIHSIQQAGGIPILCTITSANIEKYNKYMLHNFWTRHLEHTHEYPTMQRNLNLAIDTINAYIANTNRNSGVSTPFTHTAIKKRTGNSRRVRYRYNWQGLDDGIHAESDTKIRWADAISAAIGLNSTN